MVYEVRIANKRLYDPIRLNRERERICAFIYEYLSSNDDLCWNAVSLFITGDTVSFNWPSSLADMLTISRIFFNLTFTLVEYENEDFLIGTIFIYEGGRTLGVTHYNRKENR